MAEEPQKPYPHYWGNTPEQEYYNLKGIKSATSFFTSPRNFSLFTRSWHHQTATADSRPKAAVFMVHGYGNDISWTFQSTAIFLAQNNFSCFALDLEGHGRSGGLKSFVPDLDLVVDDYIAFVEQTLSENPQFKNLPKYLYGESMGGAVSLMINFKIPSLFTGAILVAPMCKISDNVKPGWPIPEILSFFAKLAPTLPIVPAADLVDKAVRVPEKRIIARMNPARYTGKPRLGTVSELIRATEYIGGRLADVDLPFLVLYGSGDVVTDPRVSEELYKVARSEDKSLKMYEGMLHSLLFGETEVNIEVVRRDILDWLNQRCSN